MTIAEQVLEDHPELDNYENPWEEAFRDYSVHDLQPQLDGSNIAVFKDESALIWSNEYKCWNLIKKVKSQGLIDRIKLLDKE